MFSFVSMQLLHLDDEPGAVRFGRARDDFRAGRPAPAFVPSGCRRRDDGVAISPINRARHDD
jgi:hypothetical protein